jgi:hypothetical protein
MGQGSGAGNPYQTGLAQNTQNAGVQAGSTYAGMQQGQGPLANANLSPYMNPYTKDVIGTTMGEMNRQEQIQGNQLASDATQQGTFGGDRFGVQMAENNRNYDQQRANTLASLNQSNFGQAQGAAQQDVVNRLNAAGGLGNMANMGFTAGNQLQQNQLAAGALQQQQQQSILDAIKGQYQGFTGQGANALASAIAAIQGMGSNLQQSHGSTSSSGSQIGFSGLPGK